MIDYLICHTSLKFKRDGMKSVLFSDYNLFYSNESNIYLDTEYLLLVDGFVYDLVGSVFISGRKIIDLILSDTLYSANITGQFSIVLYSLIDGCFHLINDYIGIRQIYYGKFDGNLLFTNNYVNLTFINGLQLDVIALVQLLTPPYYSCLGNRSPFLGINTLMSGTYKIVTALNEQDVSYDMIEGIGNCNKPEISHLKELLSGNADIFEKLTDEIILPISGGVDSRITLFSFFLRKPSVAIQSFTYGESEFIDNKIASNISKDYGINHQNISIANLYPVYDEMRKIFVNGGNILLAFWIPVLRHLENYKFSLPSQIIILGDIFDLLRAKNIKSLRSYKSRILHQLGFVSDRGVDDFIIEYESKFSSSIKRTIRNYPHVIELFDLDENNILKETLADFKCTTNHIYKLHPDIMSGNSFEEIYNILTWGRLTMANQANILNQVIDTYVFSANRHYVKSILKIDYLSRFEDSITHDLLRTSRFGNYPTIQIPYIGYNKPLFLKYFLWALRAQFDRYYDRVVVRKARGEKKTIKTINWRFIYSLKDNQDNFKSYFKGWENEFIYLLNYYDNRVQGISKALDDNDLTAGYRVCELLRSRFNR